MNRSIVVEQIIKNAAVAVIRMEDSKKLLRVVEAIYKGGVKVIEITLTVPDAINLIKTVVKEVGNEVIVGVGSVLNKELTEQSIDAGAKYVVSPIFKTEIIDAAHKYEIPALSTALNYFDGFRNGRLPANLLQAQRDYFGAHTYERIDKPRGEFFHTNWTGRGGTTASSTYNV